LVAVLVLGSAAARASAEPIDSFFDIWITGDNIVTNSTGNGYVGPGGENIWRYDTGWWNQWFFNDPQVLDRWKKIVYTIGINAPEPIQGDGLEVVINWTTPDWTNPVTPPIGPLDDEFIVRTAYIWQEPLPFVPLIFEGQIIIPDYNPVWVSIDVRATPLAGGMDQFHVYGDIHHECLPEPATLSLLALGGLGALLRRKRK
jgi:hypothetical protein